MVVEGEGGLQQKEEISFSDKSQSYCVCFVSMIDSTETTFTFNDQPDKIRRYYSIFINTMAAIVRNFDAKVIKNTGTSLVYYFPKTSSSYNNPSAFKDVIECGVTMMAADKVINMNLKEEGIPSMHYKISADYGRVEMARSRSSPNTDDLFGSTMNIGAKINSMASPNGMVIGSDLYYILKKFSSLSLFDKDTSSQYHFKKIGEYSIMSSFKYYYPVYSVSISEGKEDIISDLEKQIPIVQKQSYKVENEADGRLETRETKKEPKQRQQQTQEPQQKKGSLTTIVDTIMIVDDELDILLTYKTYLDSTGYNVDAFTNAGEALTCFANADPNTYKLVLIDIRMPNFNGIQLYYRLKAINPKIKVLFVTALDAAQEMVSTLPNIRLDDIIIRKPVDIEQFLYKVKAALEQK